MMEIKDLRALVKMITETDITEFELENAEEKIVIKRGPDKEYVQLAAPVAAPVAPALTVSAAATTPTKSVEDDPCETIDSPMVGSFYRRPSPESAPFSEVGDVIEAGQTVCLVEAMKMFNEIEAEFKCKIVEILKDDAAPVEFGEPLFKVERC
jgi:acetyl-CoA carboxylase biotin carboxyl carrier protein